MRTLKKFIRDLLWMPGRSLQDKQRGWRLPDGVDSGIPRPIDLFAKYAILVYFAGLLVVVLYSVWPWV